MIKFVEENRKIKRKRIVTTRTRNKRIITKRKDWEHTRKDWKAQQDEGGQSVNYKHIKDDHDREEGRKWVEKDGKEEENN